MLMIRKGYCKDSSGSKVRSVEKHTPFERDISSHVASHVKI